MVFTSLLSCLSVSAQIELENQDSENMIMFLVKPSANAEWLPFSGNAQELMHVQLAIDKSSRRVFVAYGDVHDKSAKYTCTNFYVDKDSHGHAIVRFTFNDHRLVIWPQGTAECLVMLENKQRGSSWKHSNYFESEEWLLTLMPDLAKNMNFNYNATGKVVRLINILDKAKRLGIIEYSAN